jgi:hypothetical protein
MKNLSLILLLTIGLAACGAATTGTPATTPAAAKKPCTGQHQSDPACLK